MLKTWKQEYEKLAVFVSEHPEIEIKPDIISIPAGYKERFYGLFDNVRMTAARANTGNSLEQSRVLVSKYKEAEAEAMRLLNLNSITSQASLQRFLDNLDDWFARELFDPLFDLVKGTIDCGKFENICTGIRHSAVPAMYQKAFGKWIAVSMISMLEADELLNVPMPKLSPRDRVAVAGKGTRSPVIAPVKSDHINFAYSLFQLFTVPDFIVHSSRLGKYVSIRTQYEDSLAEAADASAEQEWFPVNVTGDFTSDMMLIYTADSPQELSIVADRVKICRPDIIIEYKTQKNWYDIGGMGTIVMHNRGLKPLLGTYVVSEFPVNPDSTPVDIHFIMPCAESAGLTPIIDVLAALTSVQQDKPNKVPA